MSFNPRPRMRSAPPQGQPQRHNLSGSQPQPFIAITPHSTSSTTLLHRTRAQPRLQPQPEYEAVDIRTLYPPDPHYDIAEKPWLPGPQTPYVIYNAQLVDPRNSVVHKNITLHLAGGKVVNVVPTTEHDRLCDYRHDDVKAVKIDAEGYFVCPGLIDCGLQRSWFHLGNALILDRSCSSDGCTRK